MEKTYNGFTNFETWLCNLWDGSEYWSHTARQVMQDHPDAEPFMQGYELAKIMQNAYENELEDVYDESSMGGLFHDLLRNSIAEINFFELASLYLEEVYEDD